MKAFAVYSEDKALLRAFEEKLREKYFMKTNDLPGDFLCIYSADKSFVVTNHDGALWVLNLPQQWNEAVKALEELTQPQFKVGDWVVCWSWKQVAKLVEKRKDSFLTDAMNRNINQAVGFEQIHRHATKEEIKEELIRRSGLKIGDEVMAVKHKLPNEKIVAFEYITENNREYASATCHEYHGDHGDFLAVKFKNYGNVIANRPVDLVEKVENDFDFEIPTENGFTYKPKVVNNKIEIGACDESLMLTVGELRLIKNFMEFCREKELSLEFSNEGEILSYMYKQQGAHKVIKQHQIRQMIKALES